jgi:DNA-binding beta-propeller fold protein YncE
MDPSDGYDGSARAFEGERTLSLRSVPVGARITRARITVTPVAGPTGTLFEERIDFADPADASRTFGATKIPANGGAATFVEVDFHKRRTLAAVTGANLTTTELQVDLGGVYVQINDKGAILTPSDTNRFVIGADGTLPGLTVAKFKLTATTPNTPAATTVTIRSTPANVTVRLGKMAPFWARPGELAAADTSPDFTPLLQAFLATAPVENGYYLVPLVVHSDTLARLSVALDLTYLNSELATPNGLPETTLPFDVGTVANAPQQLSVSLPADARVVPGATTARVAGSFAETRIVEGYGAPTGELAPGGGATVSPQLSLAQIVEVDSPISAVAIDLSLTGITRTANLALDVRADLDGKPDGNSLLGGAVAFTLQSTPSPAPKWISVALAKEFHFASDGRPTRYWLVLQSYDGQVTWNAAAFAAPVKPGKPLPAMQQTTDGGLSWRSTTQPATLTSMFRFRYQPARYQVPIEVQVGTGVGATRVKLDRYQPLNRIDFALDLPAFAQAFNEYLAHAAPQPCSQAEHVANGDFRQWLQLGGDLGAPHVFASTSATGALALSPDGQYAYAGAADGSFALVVVDVLRDALAGAPIALASVPLFAAASPDGARVYVGTAAGLHLIDAASRTDLGAVPTRNFTPGAFGAVGPDGGYLYVASPNGVAAFATDTFAGALTTQQALNTTATASATPRGLAVSPDGTLVYVLSTDTNGSQLLVYAAPSLAFQTSTPVGTNAVALAVTPDGARVVVLDAAGPAAFVVDVASAAVVRSLAIPSGTPQAVAVSPDGARAYVFSADAATRSISVIDLARLAFTGPPISLSAMGAANPVGISVPTALAVTASGSRLYLADGPHQLLASVPIGTLTPADWTVTGKVQLSPQRGDPPTVVIGDVRSDGHDAANSAGMSQVIPVGGCGYVFSFSADAEPIERLTAVAAVAEVFWLDDACGLARTDTFPIRQARSKGPVRQRIPLQAPPGTTQAEVRFRGAPGTVIALSSVSLAGSNDAVTNGDLQQIGGDGLPSGWALTPAAARATFGVTRGATGMMRLRNAGAQTVELTQSVAVAPGALLHVELAARAEAATTSPSLAVGFLASDGSPAGTATTITIDPSDFERHPAEIAAPPNAAKANIHVRLPPATAIDLRALAVRPLAKVDVPVAFIAQAPGQLRVSQAFVAYERVAPSAPPVPAGGLCTPTPPDQTPGDGGTDDECYCSCCDAKRTMRDPTAATTPAGRPVTVGTCTTCGTTMARGGGTVMLGTAATTAAEIMQPSVVIAAPTNRAANSAAIRQPLPPVTAVAGIGPARASALEQVGITTIEQLATANAGHVAQALRGVSVPNAQIIIQHAQLLVAVSNQ